MENGVLLNSVKGHFFTCFTMLEKIIEICPDDLWNKKVASFIFWQQVVHTLAYEHFWLREDNTEFVEPFKDKKFYLQELEKDPETALTKDAVTKFCIETKAFATKWFNGRDDDWLKLPSTIDDRLTHHDVIIGQITHLMYHVGHCEAIFRENGITTGEYLDYFGEEKNN